MLFKLSPREEKQERDMNRLSYVVGAVAVVFFQLWLFVQERLAFGQTRVSP
jgi:hypothetical protein